MKYLCVTSCACLAVTLTKTMRLVCVLCMDPLQPFGISVEIFIGSLMVNAQFSQTDMIRELKVEITSW